MLAEFALTPALFDEQANADQQAWREQLRELGSGMFPRTGPAPVIVSDLYAGSWRHVAEALAGQVRDQSARYLCQGLLTRVKDVLVPRPAVADVWPDTDVDWGREAIASHATEPLHRIVATATTHAALAAEYPAIRCIAECADSGFWAGDWPSSSPPMNIASQVENLRKLCIHADFLCLITPDIYGGADDETDFAVALMRRAFQRPSGFTSVEFEIHTETKEPNPEHPDFQDFLSKRIRNVSKSVQQSLLTGQSADVVIWPKLLERLLIAGSFSETSDGKHVRRPRWGVAMHHIARKPDEKRADFFTEWKPLNAESLGRWFAAYCAAGVPGSLRRVRVTG